MAIMISAGSTPHLNAEPLAVADVAREPTPGLLSPGTLDAEQLQLRACVAGLPDPGPRTMIIIYITPSVIKVQIHFFTLKTTSLAYVG